MVALFAARAPALVSALRFRAEKDAALHWSNWATTSAGKYRGLERAAAGVAR